MHKGSQAADPAGVDDLRRRLVAAPDREAAARLLVEADPAHVTLLAARLPIPRSRRGKSVLHQSVVEATVGVRLKHEAVMGSPAPCMIDPHPDPPAKTIPRSPAATQLNGDHTLTTPTMNTESHTGLINSLRQAMGGVDALVADFRQTAADLNGEGAEVVDAAAALHDGIDPAVFGTKVQGATGEIAEIAARVQKSLAAIADLLEEVQRLAGELAGAVENAEREARTAVGS